MNLFDRRAFLRVGSIGVFGFLPLGEALRLRAQNPAKAKDISVKLNRAGQIGHMQMNMPNLCVWMNFHT